MWTAHSELPEGIATCLIQPRWTLRQLRRSTNQLVERTWRYGKKQRSLAANTADQSASAEVKIDNFSFSPANLTVAPGTTVTWINHDDIPRVVVSSDDPKVFKSKALDTDDRFSFTFTKAGTYPYFCAIHPKMTGKIIVQ